MRLNLSLLPPTLSGYLGLLGSTEGFFALEPHRPLNQDFFWAERFSSALGPSAKSTASLEGLELALSTFTGLIWAYTGLMSGSRRYACNAVHRNVLAVQLLCLLLHAAQTQEKDLATFSKWSRVLSLIPRSLITANAVEGLVKLLRRMMSGGHMMHGTSSELKCQCMHGTISHASVRPPDVILRRSFTRPSTALAVIEGLGTRLQNTSLVPRQ